MRNDGGEPTLRYHGQAVALLTQHGKENLLGPVLDAALGCRVQHVQGYDTDLLGTFTREIPRAGTQVEAARTKARLGMELAGLQLGLASEGAFGPDPVVGMLPWNVEVLLWIDDLQGIEVVASAHDSANHAQLLTGDWEAAAAFARQWNFPGHHLVLRPESEMDVRIRKGVASWGDFEASFIGLAEASSSGQVFLETDVRAHANPTRQKVIVLAAQRLAAKLCSCCPACGAPGFWRVGPIPGLPCAGCGAPTQEPLGEILGCVKCTHQVTKHCDPGSGADPARCDFCNP